MFGVSAHARDRANVSLDVGRRDRSGGASRFKADVPEVPIQSVSATRVDARLRRHRKLTANGPGRRDATQATAAGQTPSCVGAREGDSSCSDDGGGTPTGRGVWGAAWHPRTAAACVRSRTPGLPTPDPTPTAPALRHGPVAPRLLRPSAHPLFATCVHDCRPQIAPFRPRSGCSRTDIEPDNDHADTLATMSIGELFFLSVVEIGGSLEMVLGHLARH